MRRSILGPKPLHVKCLCGFVRFCQGFLSVSFEHGRAGHTAPCGLPGRARTPAFAGEGRVYRPAYREPIPGKHETAAASWIECWRDGHPHRESPKSPKASKTASVGPIVLLNLCFCLSTLCPVFLHSHRKRLSGGCGHLASSSARSFQGTGHCAAPFGQCQFWECPLYGDDVCSKFLQYRFRTSAS
jgi:hypothetical protein